MTLHTWWLFVVTTFLVSSTPGPNMLHILTRSVRLGLRQSIPAMAGCAVASGAAMAVSAAGLGAVLIASPMAFETLRYLGIAYLIFLGVQAWRSEPQTTDLAPGHMAPANMAALFRGGFLVSASNPKLLLYSAAVIPQFINPASPYGPQLVILVLTFVVGDVFWYVVYAYGGARVSHVLSRPTARRIFDRTAGGIFVLFGLALVFEKPA